ncbi:uncharacterized protein LOC111083987, partial [Limulus polyphemus]|uniref:Uncharacterized protein LOC111083987 n=1 Tax=Limulus polyphemus TaxID=6850 RepID=A0ABM1RYK7_LIMPO
MNDYWIYRMIVQPNDKILIQTIAVNKYNMNDHEVKKLWKNISPEKIFDQKLTCSFQFQSELPPSESLDVQQQSSFISPSSLAVNMSSQKQVVEKGSRSEDKELIEK